MKGSDYIEYDKALNIGFKLLKDKKKRILGLYIITAINTGLRCGDILKLKWSDILEANNNTLKLIEQKTKKPRSIQLNTNVLRAFNAFKVPNLSEHIFKSQKGSVYSIQYLNRALKDIFSIESKHKNISTHSLRKSFGRRIYESNNESEKALMYLNEMFSHSSIATTRIYLGIRQEELNNLYMNMV